MITDTYTSLYVDKFLQYEFHRRGFINIMDRCISQKILHQILTVEMSCRILNVHYIL